MAILTEEMKRMVTDLRLSYIATSSKEGIVNVSPKGSFRVVDDNTLAFRCTWSDKTIANLKENPHIAVAVLDTAARRGFQFKGAAVLEDSGPLFDKISVPPPGLDLPKANSIARITVTEVYPTPPRP